MLFVFSFVQTGRRQEKMKKQKENLDRYKHRCKEGEGRMKRGEDKARIKGGVECNGEYS